MKTYEEFKNLKCFKNAKEEVIKKYYNQHKQYYFNKWLFTFDVDEINKVGIEAFYKKFESLSDEEIKKIGELEK